MEERIESLNQMYNQLMNETLEMLIKVETLSEELGIDLLNPNYDLEINIKNIHKLIEIHTEYIQKINKEQLESEPLYFKSKLDLTYANSIKSNIVKTVENNIPRTLTDENARTDHRLELIREWSTKIVEVTGHSRRTAQDVLKGNQDIYADAVLIMEDVLPIDRDDILGRRKTGSVGEFEYVLDKLRKYMSKNRELAKDIEKIVNALIRLIGNVDERKYGNISDYITPCLEKCFDKFRESK